MKARVGEYTKQRDETVCKRFSITSELLEKWIRKFIDDKKVKEVMDDIEKLYQQCIIDKDLKEVHFDLPANLTRESYLQVMRKIQACVRHDAY